MEKSVVILNNQLFQRGKLKLDSFQQSDSDSDSFDIDRKSKIKLLLNISNISSLNSTYLVNLYLKDDPDLGRTESRNGNSIFFSRTFDLFDPLKQNPDIHIEIKEAQNSHSPINHYRIKTNFTQILLYEKIKKTFCLNDYQDINYSYLNDKSNEFNHIKDSPELKIETLYFEENKSIYELDIQLSDRKNFYIDDDRWYFFVLSNKLDRENFRILYKSEEIDIENMNFDKVELSSRDLCLNDLEREIKIELYKKDSNRGAIEVLQTVNKINKLLDKEKTNKLTIILSPQILDKSPIIFNNENQAFLVENEKNVFDSLKKHDLKMNLTIAIDMTLSNGTPEEKNSLHYRKGENPYSKAIKSVGNFFEKYDDDKKFPVYIFGAEIKLNKENTNCYHLNRNPYDPNIEGIENVIQTYYKIFDHISLSYENIFSEFLKEVLKNIKSERQYLSQKTYNVLLILTDGLIDKNDMQNVKNVLVELSDYPISIVIVGIGDLNFEEMKILDGDKEEILDSKGKKARDIVQFVDFFKLEYDEQKLKEAVFEEIPRQIEEYIKLKKNKFHSYF